MKDGVPFAETIELPFDMDYPNIAFAHRHEKLIWQLSHILLNDFDDEISEGIPDIDRARYEDRIRKDRLSFFWANMCRDEARDLVKASRTTEERAIAYLSMNAVTEACIELADSKNFRLATLVAQIGGDTISRRDLRDQIDEWGRLNILSEMTDPVRALYELVAGNTCLCEGRKGPTEDQAKQFVISERFRLDWKMAFGLKLWYGTLKDEPLEVAIEKFAADLDDKRETAKPLPWFLNDASVKLPWEDKDGDSRTDVLWGILKLYAEGPDTVPSKTLAEVVMPENVTGNPLSQRLPFELYHTLAPYFPRHLAPATADQLALGFAAELESAGEWQWGLVALLRLSDPTQRQQAIQAHVAQHAADIDEEDGDLLQTLFYDFQLPEAWVWEAKALHARAVLQDHVAEVNYLLKAHSWNEAHRVLCDTVAPQCIIGRDHDGLRRLLGGFSYESKPTDWRTGGEVYVDYLHLLKMEDAGERKKLLSRLMRGLSDMASSRKGKGGFLQGVAVQEMSAVVGEKVLENTDQVSSPSTNERSLAEMWHLEQRTIVGTAITSDGGKETGDGGEHELGLLQEGHGYRGISRRCFLMKKNNLIDGK